MERIGIRDLRQHASRYLDQVKAGATVEVTERGRLVALLVPPSPATAARERLIADGRIRPAARPFAVPSDRTRSDEGPTAAALDALREER